MLAQNHEQPCPDDDRGADQHRPGRHIAKDEIADQDAEHDRGILERCNRRHIGMPVALGQQDLPQPYLNELERIGILKSQKVGVENLYLNVKLVEVLKK